MQFRIIIGIIWNLHSGAKISLSGLPPIQAIPKNYVSSRPHDQGIKTERKDCWLTSTLFPEQVNKSKQSQFNLAKIWHGTDKLKINFPFSNINTARHVSWVEEIVGVRTNPSAVDVVVQRVELRVKLVMGLSIFRGGCWFVHTRKKELFEVSVLIKGWPAGRITYVLIVWKLSKTARIFPEGLKTFQTVSKLSWQFQNCSNISGLVQIFHMVSNLFQYFKTDF